VSFHVTDTKKIRAYIEFLVSKSVILFRRWRRLWPVTDGGDDFTCTRETKEEGKRCIKIGAAEKGEKGMRVICDAAQQDESQICTHISDASGQHASLLLSVTCFVEKSH
jgi:hypothetical protein